MELSTTEENYLKIIYLNSRPNPEEPQLDQEVHTNTIADLTQTKAASVSDMLKKLANKQLINYVKYQGVTLSELGKRIALDIIRKHRLWEVFLVEKLKFKGDQVGSIAEQLEHIQSEELTKRLDEFLGYPKFDPHGNPIPDEQGTISNKKQIFLHTMEIGDKGDVVGVKETSTPFLRYLDKIGVSIGVHIEVVDKIEYDQSLEIRVNNERIVIISHEIAQNIYTIG